MKTDIAFIGKKYKVISGHYKGFIGTCVSYDLRERLPIILQDENWNGRAVKASEVECIDNKSMDISRTQKN